MADIYYPETIADEAFPIPGSVTVPSSGGGSSTSSKEVQTPSTVPPKSFPERLIAHETISSAFNTIEKKIKGAFEFGKYGALKIGEFVQGVSGEIAFTPNGMVAKNANGETTVGIDGTTGDAVFKGKLQAGTLIGGDNKVVIEQVDGNGRIVIYDDDDNPVVVLGYMN